MCEFVPYPDDPKAVKIVPPEGYEIDIENSTSTSIFFKRKDTLPVDWYHLHRVTGYYIDSNSDPKSGNYSSNINCRNMFTSKEQALASVALAQLSQLMKVYNEGWRPNWRDDDERKYVIYYREDSVRTSCEHGLQRFLALKTAELRDIFLDKFENLIEQAKPLL